MRPSAQEHSTRPAQRVLHPSTPHPSPLAMRPSLISPVSSFLKKTGGNQGKSRRFAHMILNTWMLETRRNGVPFSVCVWTACPVDTSASSLCSGKSVCPSVRPPARLGGVRSSRGGASQGSRLPSESAERIHTKARELLLRNELRTDLPTGSPGVA